MITSQGFFSPVMTEKRSNLQKNPGKVQPLCHSRFGHCMHRQHSSNTGWERKTIYGKDMKGGSLML